MSMFGRVREALRPASVLVVSGALAAIVTAASISIGLIGDDLVHRQFLLEQLNARALHGTWWNMFGAHTDVAASIAVGQLPWWSSPHLQLAFLRPLATLSQYVDYVLWPAHPALMHLHNVVLYVLVAMTASYLYRSLLASSATVWLASILYAIDDAHALGTAWIASRNTLLTALWSLVCLASFQYGRTRGRRPAIAFAALALLLAHASSEGAIAVWAYLLAYAAFIDTAPFWQRLRALSPLVFVSVSWTAIAAVSGFGVHGGGAYLDPREDLVQFAVALPERLPRLLIASFGITEEVASGLPPAAVTFLHAAVVLLLIALIVYVTRAWRRDPVVRFLVAGCLGSLLPVCAAGPIGRLLFISGWGIHALIAQLLVAMFAAGMRDRARQLRRVFASAGTALTLVVALYGAAAAPAWWVNLHHYFREQANALPRGWNLIGSTILTVNARDYLSTPFIMLYRHLFAGPGPTLMHILGVSTDRVRVVRPDDDSLLLEPEHGYLNDATSILVRSRNERFSVGQEQQLAGAMVRVEALTADGRPARVRVQTANLNDPKLVWVVWNDEHQRFERFAVPPVGGMVELPPQLASLDHR